MNFGNADVFAEGEAHIIEKIRSQRLEVFNGYLKTGANRQEANEVADLVIKATIDAIQAMFRAARSGSSAPVMLATLGTSSGLLCAHAAVVAESVKDAVEMIGGKISSSPIKLGD